MSNWRSIANQFADTHTVLIFDQRGHGRSFKPPNEYKPENYAKDLQLILKELNWSSIELVGHSMGARNALLFCHLFPDLCHKLVLEDLGPEVKNEDFYGFNSFQEYLLAIVPTPFSTREEAKKFMLNELPEKLKSFRGGQQIAMFMYSNITENKKDNSYDWRFSKEAILETIHLGRFKNYWSEWKLIKVPTLVIRGEESTYLTSDIFDRMLTENSNSRGIVVKNAGHWVHYDQSEVFIKELKQFLSEER
jgi:pimeloyl-ACP methyl ester carboxylesterase